MKKVTIIGLGGAGINFLNSLRKKELENLDLKLLPIEDENIDKNLIEKEVIKDSKVFVVIFVLFSQSLLSVQLFLLFQVEYIVLSFLSILNIL